MIRVDQEPVVETRSPDRSCVWEAVCEIGGVQYRARSRYGAVNELARQLVAAGIPDAPMAVRQHGLAGEMVDASFYEAAKWTYREGAASLHRVRWVDPAAQTAQIAIRKAARQGWNRFPAPAVAAAASPPQIAEVEA
jgi:hypothetical protein